MKKSNLISKFLFAFSLSIFLLGTTAVFAESISDSPKHSKTVIQEVVGPHWERGTATTTKIGDWELISTGNTKYVETEQIYNVKTTASRVATVTASIEASGGFVTGTASAGYTSTGEEEITISYKIITKQIITYNLYYSYKYYYTESILVDAYGNVLDSNPYGYITKKEYYSSKQVITGSKAP